MMCTVPLCFSHFSTHSEKLKTILNLDRDILVEYKTFKRSLKDKSTYSNTQQFTFAVADSGARTARNRRGQNKKTRGSGSTRARNNNSNNAGAPRRNQQQQRAKQPQSKATKKQVPAPAE